MELLCYNKQVICRERLKVTIYNTLRLKWWYVEEILKFFLTCFDENIFQIPSKRCTG